MVKSCAVVDCRTNVKKQNGKVTTIQNQDTVFQFPDPIKKPELFKKWVRFVNRQEFTVMENSGMCAKHFEDKFIKVGKRKTLRWDLDPEPTIYAVPILPSLIPTPETKRKKPTDRSIIPDEMATFTEVHQIKSLSDIDSSMCPSGFVLEMHQNTAIFYKLERAQNNVPEVTATIIIDEALHVKLFKKSSPIPLPEWFRKGGDCKCKQLSILQNFPNYIKNYTTNNSSDSVPQDILDELQKIRYRKPHQQPKYSPNLIRYSLLIFFTSPQAYRLLLDQLPFPSESMLRKLTSGGVDAIKACKILLDKGHMDKDVVLLVDEIYIQKEGQYVGGEYIGADGDGKLFKGVVVFMIVSLKKDIPFVVKAIPETSITGVWLQRQIDATIYTLHEKEFNVRAVICDNHASNVCAYKHLLLAYGHTSKPDTITHPSNGQSIYLFYDAVHLIKNIRNNLLAYRHFSFPEFSFKEFYDDLFVPEGNISWKLLHDVHDKDQLLINTNLRKAPKVSYKTLHPGDNKQNVQLALNIFHESTSAAIASYFPENKSASAFLNLINIWWKIANAKLRYNSNFRLGDAAVPGDRKPQFLRKFADWIQEWEANKNTQCLSSQTASALVTTLRFTASLIEDLFQEGYTFVLTARFQSDPLERRFSRYRQMNGGRFLVALREVNSSERVLALTSLLKENVDITKEDLAPDSHKDVDIKRFEEHLTDISEDIQSCMLSPYGIEVAAVIAGYIVHKSKCQQCKMLSTATDAESAEYQYLKELSRGGMKIPTVGLCHHVAKSFALLDMCQQEIEQSHLPVRHASQILLKRNDLPVNFLCPAHISSTWGINKVVINVFWNNHCKNKNNETRRDCVNAFKQRQTEKKNN